MTLEEIATIFNFHAIVNEICVKFLMDWSIR